MALRWFATGPIRFHGVRAFNAGDYVPDSIVTLHGLDTDDLVTQVDVPAQDPAVITRPLTTSDRDTDDEREAFVPSRLSAEALRAAFDTWDEEGGGAGSGITPGTEVGQIPVWDGNSYEPQAPGDPTADIEEIAATRIGAVAGQVELQPMWVTGHSWFAVDTNATPGARVHQRLARRVGSSGTPTNRAQSGRTIGDIATATLSGSNGWTPRTRAFAIAVCTINDITLFDGSAASRRGFAHAWRTLLAQLTANAAVAANTTSFVYSANWTAETVAVSTAQAAATNSTGGSRFTTSTVGSYFEFTVSGAAVDVFLVARAAGAGLCTFSVGSTTVGTLDLTATTAQDTPAVAKLRGLGSGAHTVRGTLTSGASLTVDSIRVPASSPTIGLILGEPPVIPTGTDHATYLADLAVFKADLAEIVAEYPTFVYADLNQPGWDSSMLTDDGKHPNDKGCAWIASRAHQALVDAPAWSTGLHVLNAAPQAAYTPPTGPVAPSGGQDGTGVAGSGGTPVAPTALTIAATPGNGEVTITASGGTGSGVTYALYRDTTATGTPIATSFPFTDTGLTSGTPVSYIATATNAGGSVTSNVATATPAPVSVTAVADTFNRADAPLAGSTTTTGGKVWALDGSTIPTVVSQQVKAAAGGSGNSAVTVDCGSADGDVQATLAALSGATASMISGLCLRYVDANNYLSVQIRRSGTDQEWALVKRVAGTATVVSPGRADVPAAGDVVKAEMRGDTIRVLINGAERVPPQTVTEFTSATKHGLYFNGTDTVSTWDDWSFTPVA